MSDDPLVYAQKAYAAGQFRLASGWALQVLHADVQSYEAWRLYAHSIQQLSRKPRRMLALIYRLLYWNQGYFKVSTFVRWLQYEPDMDRCWRAFRRREQIAQWRCVALSALQRATVSERLVLAECYLQLKELHKAIRVAEGILEEHPRCWLAQEFIEKVAWLKVGYLG